MVKRIGAVLKKRKVMWDLYQKLMMTFCSIFFLSVLAIAVTSGEITREYELNNYKNYSNQAMLDINRNLTYITDDVATLSRFLISDEMVQKLISLEAGDGEYNPTLRSVKETMLKLIIDKDYVESVSIYNLAGDIVTVGAANSYLTQYSVLCGQQWFGEMKSRKGGHIWVNTQFNGIQKVEDRIVFGRIINKLDSQTAVGTMIVTLKNNYLATLLNGSGSHNVGAVYAINDEGKILFAPPDSKPEYEKTLEEQEMYEAYEEGFFEVGSNYLTVCRVQSLGWNLICINSRMIVIESLLVTLMTLVFVSICACGFAVIIYSRFARRLNRSVHVMTDAMDRAEETKYKEEMPLTEFHMKEFIRLGETYNQMIRKMGFLINEVMQQKLNIKQAQLESLQAKINPHFLYNTLDVINLKAMENDQDEISEMIISLSEMFRFSLGNGEKEVLLKEEIESTRFYLLLQKKRMGDRLRYLIDISENINNYFVIKFILQPLVENSIIHGLKDKEGRGYVGVTAEEQEDWLVLSVFDNGRGIVESQIQQILDGNASRADGKKHGHGIYNVNERLRIRYGEESQLRFSNRKNGGTQVTIRILKDKLIHKEGDCYHV